MPLKKLSLPSSNTSGFKDYVMNWVSPALEGDTRTIPYTGYAWGFQMEKDEKDETAL